MSRLLGFGIMDAVLAGLFLTLLLDAFNVAFGPYQVCTGLLEVCG